MEGLIHAFGIDTTILVAQVVNFVVLAALLTWFLYKPVMKAVNERQKVIEQGLLDAKESALQKEQGELARKEIEREARTKAEYIVSQAEQVAQSQKQDILADAQRNKEAIVASAHEQAKAAADKVTQEAKKKIAADAVLAVEKLMKV
jgi:F-type H+-transporting ATPase subunit b